MTNQPTSGLRSFRITPTTAAALEYAASRGIRQADFLDAAVSCLLSLMARNGLIEDRLKKLLQSAEQQGETFHQKLIEELDGEPDDSCNTLDEPKAETMAAYLAAIRDLPQPDRVTRTKKRVDMSPEELAADLAALSAWRDKLMGRTREA